MIECWLIAVKTSSKKKIALSLHYDYGSTTEVLNNVSDEVAAIKYAKSHYDSDFEIQVKKLDVDNNSR